MSRPMSSVLLAFALLAPFAVSAEEAVKDPFVGASPADGEAKAAACGACHGTKGVSAMPDWPKLAAQGSPYIVHQLQQFKAGERKNPIMQAQAAALSDQDMKDLGAYFSAQAVAPGVASKDAVAVAEKIYRAGAADRSVPACAACHGPTGAGNPGAAYPRLGGQHAKYTAAQLHAYKAGERVASANAKLMASIAGQLSDQEIEALASYVNGLQ